MTLSPKYCIVNSAKLKVNYDLNSTCLNFGVTKLVLRQDLLFKARARCDIYSRSKKTVRIMKGINYTRDFDRNSAYSC